MTIVQETVVRESVEATLTHIGLLVLRDGKGVLSLHNPSRVFFRKDGKVTVRSGNSSVTLSAFQPVAAFARKTFTQVDATVLPIAATPGEPQRFINTQFDGAVYFLSDDTLKFESAGEVFESAHPAGTLPELLETGHFIPLTGATR